MKIAICEDEPIYQTAVQQAIHTWKSTTGSLDVEVSCYPSSEDLLERLDRQFDVDLFFIDIEIPGELNGMELAKKIRERHMEVTLVFCTNYSEYVFDGYTVNALRYLKKPISEKEIAFCCDYAYRRASLKNEDALTFFSGGTRYVLRYTEIRYFEVQSHTLYISHTLSDSLIRISSSLSDLMPVLPKNLFAACHRSYIVNLMHIRKLTRTECLLQNRETIPISRTYTKAVAEAFDRFHQGRGTWLWHG